MKRNTITMATGIVVALIFAAMLFAFQVRQTEVAVVTTFGKFSHSITNDPGLHYRLPWPIQKVHRFDNRIRNFEKKYEQTTTRDGRVLMVDVFLGWRVADPKVFLERFAGDVASAERRLEGLLGNAKNGVVGQHPLRDFISTNEKELQFDLIEKEMLANIQPDAASYGIEVRLLGIKQIGLPESITAKVFERMKAEREQQVKQVKGQGDAEAIKIRSDADRQREQILAEAERQATILAGEADAEAAQSLKVFEQNPELAIFLLKCKALLDSLKERATLVLDTRTPPFDLLKGQPELPAGKR
jgi:membrane protease subunit HflC